MAVFIDNVPDHRWHPGAVGKRPVGNGQAGVVAGDQRAGDEKQKRCPGGPYSKTVQRQPVFHTFNPCYRDARQSAPPSGEKLNSTLLVSFAATVTFCSTVPNFSCQATKV